MLQSTRRYRLLALAWLIPVSAFAAPPTRVDYARRCAAEMGAISAFNCMMGAIIPITKNGVAVTAWRPGEDCDNPVQLGLTRESQCVPFSRFLRITTANPDVETAVICRKYHVNDNGPNDTKFTDIAVVQHNRATGNTCFFQSALGASLDGTSVPSPQDDTPAAAQYWQEVKTHPDGTTGPAGVQCNTCHDADPFIWSKYIIQVADVTKWNPLGSWHSNYQEIFGAGNTVKTFRPAGNACTTCHRIGSMSSSRSDDGRGHVSVKEVADKRWMLPGFAGTAADWNQLYGDAVEELYKCTEDPTRPNCGIVDHTGVDLASFVSQSMPALPLQRNQPFSVTATFKNTGTLVWRGSHTLAAVQPQTGPAWTATAVPIGSATAPVMPGGEGTQTLAFTAPATAGTYSLSVGVFAPSTYGPQRIGIGTPLTVVVPAATGQFDSSAITVVSFPGSLAAGASGTVAVSVRNNGNTQWLPGSYILRLSRINRISLPVAQVALPFPLAPGGPVNLQFTIICASRGTGGFSVQMVGPNGPFGPSAGRTVVCQ